MRDHHWLAAARLGVGVLAGVAVLVGSLVAGASWQVALSGAWCGAALAFLVWVWTSIWGKDAAATAEHATAEDVSRTMADVIVLGASVASLGAVGYTLVEASGEHGTAKVLLIVLVIATVVLAWLSVHTIYTLRYADLYYRAPVGGIDFKSDELPEYRDFAYVALTIGMTYQVSDTDLQTKKIRRPAIRHALLSFLFGAVIVAITINVVASLLNKQG
jgi:uncharacterized membrane protein